MEHDVVCRYLYAANGLKKRPEEGGVTWPQLERVRSFAAVIYDVAREEMEHLGLVCNLLGAIGASPFFARPDPSRGFVLRRLDERTLAEFVAIERAHASDSEVGERARTGDSATDEHARPPTAEAGLSPEEGVPTPFSGEVSGGVDSNATPNEAPETIGELYRRIRDGFEYVSRDNPLLYLGPQHAQVVNRNLELPAGWFGVNLIPVHDLATALRAIDQIVEASGGEQGHGDASHAARFERILRELTDMRRSDPDFAPARPVASNPTLRSDLPQGTLIRHPQTRLAAELFNDAYETMLAMLARFYAPAGETPEERACLGKLVFFPLMTMVLRPLGEILTYMPIDEHSDAATAGPTFECASDLALPPDPVSAWTLLHERMNRLVDTCRMLTCEVAGTDASWSAAVRPRLAFLEENLARAAYDFAHETDLQQAQVKRLLIRVASATGIDPSAS